MFRLSAIKEVFSSPHIKAICIFTAIVRILISLVLTDFTTNYYWEYGEIGKNILQGKGYSFYYFQDEVLRHRVADTTEPFPSAYMPPGYVVFLLPFLTIENDIARNIFIILAHIVISVFTVVILYTFTRNYFSETTAVISGYLFSIIPDFLYAVFSYTPTILFLFGTLLVLILSTIKSTDRVALILGVTISLMIHLRSEFAIFVLLILGVFAYHKEWKKLTSVVFIVMLIQTPWVIRNYQVFDTFIPFTTSAGLNLYRGNNPDGIGAWGNSTTNAQIKSLNRNEMFEVEFNALFLQRAVEHIKAHPFDTAVNIPVKLFDLWVFNRHSERSNLYYNIYSVIFSLLFFIGLTRCVSSKYLLLYLFFIYFSVVVSVFFCLPRYQTMMRIGMVPFVAAGIEYVSTLFNKKTQIIS